MIISPTLNSYRCTATGRICAKRTVTTMVRKMIEVIANIMLRLASYLMLFAVYGVVLACGWNITSEGLSTRESSARQSHLTEATAKAVPEQVSDSVSAQSAFVTGVAGSGVDLGQSSLKERIANADVIARVTLRSITSSTEQFDTPDSLQTDETMNDGYVRSIDFAFDVLDYLKGTGGTALVAVVYGGQSYPTATEAAANGPDLQVERDTQWDDREAIVFLESTHRWLPSISQADRYRLGTRFGYMLDSSKSKQWLPVANPQSSSSPVNDNRRYLTDVPSASSTPTITLGELKVQIAAIEQEVRAGDGSEAYRECIADKYWQERLVQNNLNGTQPYQRYDSEIGSGLPSGSHVFEDGLAKTWRAQPVNRRSQFWLEENDNDLFVAEWPGVITTARPLPAGIYQYYYLSRLPEFIPCGAYPEQLKRSLEHFVTVTAPSGTTHEAFFDPVTIGMGVGADATNGVLKPATFTDANGASATIRSISYESGTVKVEVTPADALAGQILDIMELDGTVSLSLDVSDAAVDGANDTLIWSVSSQPWEDGDRLMVRIYIPVLSMAPTNLTGTIGTTHSTAWGPWSESYVPTTDAPHKSGITAPVSGTTTAASTGSQ